MKTQYDVIIVGAGAAGLMCAIEAGKRGRKVWLIDHAAKLAEKIRISGGGRCNFTNIHTKPENYISTNPHFCKSALKQFTPQDFIALVEKHGIGYHEKKLGQLFCDDSAQQIIDMLLSECSKADVKINNETTVETIEYAKDHYYLSTSRGTAACQSLVIATGGLSIPKIGASKFGYDVARRFGINVIETAPALVPLTFQTTLLERCRALSGLSVKASVTCNQTTFCEGLLFTHRGLSGPSILQISSYWREGDEIAINLAPETDVFAFLKKRKTSQGKQDIQTALSHILPQRLAQSICEAENINGRLADLPDKTLRKLAATTNGWHIKPAGTEGYRTAEVTRQGVDTSALSSKTMEAKAQPGLYFIGEVVDVTGHLGGFNFQWAWSSGYAAGQHV
ncbi:MAG TPA: NAD(P)/FAD-dependent oxidoreductase [Alphaproteobacteria bacterium]|nr:MAG: NAD(P)/FAD-dependent oxidoreductase [Rhodospirillales bacterium]HOO82175.1 NAD(P)/FAD-dependent oxidoreductase [Alphaproteobacteria bacterium]